MRNSSARVAVVVLCLSLLAFGVPARSRDQVYSFSATDPNTGASGQFFFQYDDSGQLQFINGYASTSDWSAGVWWSPSGGWQYGSVTFSDPTLDAPSGRDSFSFSRALSREDPFGDPPPNYPVDPPVPGLGPETCAECVGRKRGNCDDNYKLAIGASLVGAGAFTYTCVPEAVPGAPATAGATIAGCIVIGVGILGFGTWTAAKLKKQCYQDAIDFCIDPNSGKTCRAIGW
jgi:hypothetical protein